MLDLLIKFSSLISLLINKSLEAGKTNLHKCFAITITVKNNYYEFFWQIMHCEINQQGHNYSFQLMSFKILIISPI